MSEHNLYFGDNLTILREYVADENVNLIYIDPPFNTGKHQLRTEIQVEQDDEGDRVGFKGKTYKTHNQRKKRDRYADKFDRFR